ncbi:unnamed protein product, partial [Eretmochelys imbricata]
SPPVHDVVRPVSSHMQSTPLCSCYEQGRVPLCLAAASWIGGFVITLVTILFMANLTFCSPNETDNFFCDFTPLLKLACSDTYLFEKVSFFLSSTLMLVPFLLIVLSYIYILSAILNRLSTAGPQKAIFHFQFLDLSMTHYVALDISHNLLVRCDLSSVCLGSIFCKSLPEMLENKVRRVLENKERSECEMTSLPGKETKDGGGTTEHDCGWAAGS